MKVKTNITELRSKKVPELLKLLLEKKHELIRSTMDVHFGKNKNVASLSRIRKNIAHIETVINELIREESK